MVSNSDLQQWQAAVNGINAAGQQELTGEEWAALVALNNSLQSGNFESDESRRAFALLKDSLSRHNNNQLLQIHLKNFVALCEKYFKINTPTATTLLTKPTAQSTGTVNSNAGKTKRGSNKVLIFTVVALIAGYMVYNSQDFEKEKLGRKPEKVKEVAATSTTDPGVTINGVKWATRNVDAPGTFAAVPESAGMFYQWNKKVGWSTTDPLVNTNGGKKWDGRYADGGTASEGTEWVTDNDPSPTGWRVPTGEEIKTLLDTEKVSNEWIIQNGVNGRKFTDKITGNSLFFPAVGCREPHCEAIPEFESAYVTVQDCAHLWEVGVSGWYWSATTRNNGFFAYLLSFGIKRAIYGENESDSGHSIRPVAIRIK